MFLENAKSQASMGWHVFCGLAQVDPSYPTHYSLSWFSLVLCKSSGMGCIMIYSIRGCSHWENAHNFKNIYIER